MKIHQMLTYLYKISCLLVLNIILSGCLDQNCVEADDFGNTDFTVPVIQDYTKIFGQKEGQYVNWIDSGYYTNGDPLVIVVNNWDKRLPNNANYMSAWSPWYATQDDGAALPDIATRFTSCTFVSSGNIVNYQVNNPPCVMTKGKGLYAAIVKPSYNINASYYSNTQPDPQNVLALHAGEELATPFHTVDSQGNMQTAGGLWFNWTDDYGANVSSLKSAPAKLYFKILDSYYGDNSGQYQIQIKSGVDIPNSDPIQIAINLVKEFLFGSTVTNSNSSAIGSNISKDPVSLTDKGIIHELFQGVAQNPYFQNAVNTTLILYVIFTSMGFLIGVINLTSMELVTRIVKISIISVLLTPNSWQFFYDYLFVFFIDGTSYLIELINDSSYSGPGSDSIIMLMISPQTLVKLMSLLFIDWAGFIYIILYFILLGYLMFVLIKASVLYLNALIIIGIIITMAPIFLCFMLFEFTNKFFENWLKQLVAYTLQPIILFTGITFMSILVRHEIYTSLGFKVCKLQFPDLGAIQDLMELQNSFYTRSIFYWWIPQPYKTNDFNRSLVNIYVPEGHYPTTPISNASGSTELCTANPEYDSYSFLPPIDLTDQTPYCSAYECIEPRFMDFPFLDPNVNNDCEKAKSFMNDGRFVNFNNALLLAIIIFLISRFNDVSVEIGMFIAGSFGPAGSGALNLGSLTSQWFNSTNLGLFAMKRLKSTSTFNALRTAWRANTISKGFQNVKSKLTELLGRKKPDINDYAPNDPRFRTSKEITRDKELFKELSAQEKQLQAMRMAILGKNIDPSKLTAAQLAKIDPKKLKELLAKEREVLKGKIYKDLAKETILPGQKYINDKLQSEGNVRKRIDDLYKSYENRLKTDAQLKDLAGYKKQLKNVTAQEKILLEKLKSNTLSAAEKALLQEKLENITLSKQNLEQMIASGNERKIVVNEVYEKYRQQLASKFTDLQDYKAIAKNQGDRASDLNLADVKEVDQKLLQERIIQDYRQLEKSTAALRQPEQDDYIANIAIYKKAIADVSMQIEDKKQALKSLDTQSTEIDRTLKVVELSDEIKTLEQSKTNLERLKQIGELRKELSEQSVQKLNVIAESKALQEQISALKDNSLEGNKQKVALDTRLNIANIAEYNKAIADVSMQREDKKTELKSLDTQSAGIDTTLKVTKLSDELQTLEQSKTNLESLKKIGDIKQDLSEEAMQKLNVIAESKALQEQISALKDNSPEGNKQKIALDTRLNITKAQLDDLSTQEKILLDKYKKVIEEGMKPKVAGGQVKDVAINISQQLDPVVINDLRAEKQKIPDAKQQTIANITPSGTVVSIAKATEIVAKQQAMVNIVLSEPVISTTKSTTNDSQQLVASENKGSKVETKIIRSLVEESTILELKEPDIKEAVVQTKLANVQITDSALDSAQQQQISKVEPTKVAQAQKIVDAPTQEIVNLEQQKPIVSTTTAAEIDTKPPLAGEGIRSTTESIKVVVAEEDAKQQAMVKLVLSEPVISTTKSTTNDSQQLVASEDKGSKVETKIIRSLVEESTILELKEPDIKEAVVQTKLANVQMTDSALDSAQQQSDIKAAPTKVVLHDRIVETPKQETPVKVVDPATQVEFMVKPAKVLQDDTRFKTSTPELQVRVSDSEIPTKEIVHPIVDARDNQPIVVKESQDKIAETNTRSDTPQQRSVLVEKNLDFAQLQPESISIIARQPSAQSQDITINSSQSKVVANEQRDQRSETQKIQTLPTQEIVNLEQQKPIVSTTTAAKIDTKPPLAGEGIRSTTESINTVEARQEVLQQLEVVQVQNTVADTKSVQLDAAQPKLTQAIDTGPTTDFAPSVMNTNQESLQLEESQKLQNIGDDATQVRVVASTAQMEGMYTKIVEPPYTTQTAKESPEILVEQTATKVEIRTTTESIKELEARQDGLQQLENVIEKSENSLQPVAAEEISSKVEPAKLLQDETRFEASPPEWQVKVVDPETPVKDIASPILDTRDNQPLVVKELQDKIAEADTRSDELQQQSTSNVSYSDATERPQQLESGAAQGEAMTNEAQPYQNIASDSRASIEQEAADKSRNQEDLNIEKLQASDQRSAASDAAVLQEPAIDRPKDYQGDKVATDPMVYNAEPRVSDEIVQQQASEERVMAERREESVAPKTAPHTVIQEVRDDLITTREQEEAFERAKDSAFNQTPEGSLTTTKVAEVTPEGSLQSTNVNQPIFTKQDLLNPSEENAQGYVEKHLEQTEKLQELEKKTEEYNILMEKVQDAKASHSNKSDSSSSSRKTDAARQAGAEAAKGHVAPVLNRKGKSNESGGEDN